MKLKLLFIAIAAALLAGCASPQSVEKLEGKGLKRTFPAPYADVWKSAINACRHGVLSVSGMDTTNGIIHVETQTRLDSWGEYVAVWVRKVNATNTEVEVVSRRVGPHDFFVYDWERPILNDIATDFNLPLIPEPPIKPTLNPHSVNRN
jgi:hypothetical protein